MTKQILVKPDYLLRHGDGASFGPLKALIKHDEANPCIAGLFAPPQRRGEFLAR